MAKLGFHLMQLLPTKVVIGITTLFRLGYQSRAPGTLGSIVGVLWYFLILYHLSPATCFIVSGFLIYLAILFCDEAEIRMKKEDPKEIILDEFVAIPLCFIYMEPIIREYSVWIVAIAGFLLFRFFDIVKPLGIKKLQKIKGGAGVVVDDLAAALATCACLHLGFFVWSLY